MAHASGKSSPRDPLSTSIRLLARRPYSVAGLHRALEKKFGDSPAVQETVSRLRELGYLSDEKFALQYATFLAHHRGFGSERIRRELRAKLVEDCTIDTALAQAAETSSEKERLERALAKKLRTLRLPFTTARFYALCNSLARLGFRSDDIMNAVRARPELKSTSWDKPHNKF